MRVKREIIHLANGVMVAEPTINYRSTNANKTEEYGYIKVEGRTIQVKRTGRHTWEERKQS